MFQLVKDGTIMAQCALNFPQKTNAMLSVFKYRNCPPPDCWKKCSIESLTPHSNSRQCCFTLVAKLSHVPRTPQQYASPYLTVQMFVRNSKQSADFKITSNFLEIK